MPFTIINKDITKMEVDAIVNSTNNFAVANGGADLAIHEASGPELMKARLALGKIPLGQAGITKGYKLKAKHVIHVIAPRFIDGNHNEKHYLEETYLAAMNMAISHNLESIAFPLISSGSLGFPWPVALAIALSSVKRFLANHELLVYILVYDEFHPLDDDAFDTEIAAYFKEKLITDSIDLEAARYDRKEVNFASLRKAAKGVKTLPETITNVDETFSMAILRMIDERDLTDSYVYYKANIGRKLFSKIRSNTDYQPSKITVIALALALELNLEETNSLLAKAGFTLSQSQKFDRAIEYFITHQLYDLYEINAALFSFGLKTIGLDL